MDYERLELGADAFEVIARAALDGGIGVRGRVGHGDSHLFDAAPLTAFAVAWLERRFGGSRRGGDEEARSRRAGRKRGSTPCADSSSSPARRCPDPNFARTVVLVCEHSEDGALGLVLNRAGELRVWPSRRPS